MEQYGGSAIASGSYGCVFYPSLKCKNKSSNSTGVSKLMLKRHAKKEYDDIVALKKILSSIPNYERYFVLATEKCEPDRLTPEDMENMESKCKRFSDAKTKISKYDIVNIPFGGYDIDNYLKTGITLQKFLKINKSLKHTINHGVIPMNKLNVYHFDLKIDNLLINDKGEIKLIDWGFTIFHDNKIPSVHNEVEYKSFNFNLPFSLLLFSEMYVLLINDYLNKNSDKLDVLSLSNFVKSVFKKYDDENKHYKITNIILNVIVNELNLSTSSEDLIFRYLGLCVHKYIKQTSANEYYFDHISLFNEVFLKNCDLFGSLTVYFSLLEYVTNYPFLLNLKSENSLKQFRNQLCKIIYEHMIEDGRKLINVNSFFKDIDSLKTHFKSSTRKNISVLSNRTLKKRNKK